MNIDWEFYENLDEAVYVSDMETYELEYLNRRCLQDCGIASLDQVKGKKCYEVLQKSSSPCAICTNQFLSPGHFYEWKYTNPVLQKTYLLKDTEVHRNGRRYRMELTVDVSTQERQHDILIDYANSEAMINEALRIALEQENPERGLAVILEHVGRYLKSERVYIFEGREKESVSNTYEWCADGVSAEIENLQDVPFETVELWYRTFRKHENVIIPDLEATKDSDPLAYEVLKPQGIWSLVTSPIRIGGEIVGFFGVDNAPTGMLNNISVQLDIIGHFLASLIRRRDLMKRLEYLSYYDKLTGLKNRHAMDKYLETLAAGESVGVICCDVMGLKRLNDTQGHQSGDALLQRVGQCLSENFAGSEQFRVGGDEFLVLCRNMTQEEMLHQIDELRIDMKAKDSLMAVGAVWEPWYQNNFDELLKEADAQMYADKRAYYSKLQVDRRQQK